MSINIGTMDLHTPSTPTAPADELWLRECDERLACIDGLNKGSDGPMRRLPCFTAGETAGARP